MEQSFARALPRRSQPFSGLLLSFGSSLPVSAPLLWGIMEQESGSGATLDANLLGDQGHGHGLMQIDDRTHADLLATGDYRDPATNISWGAQILRAAFKFFEQVPSSAIVVGGVKIGGNGLPDPRPLQGARLLTAAVSAYNTGEGNVLKSLALNLSPDSTTTGRTYGASVIGRMSALVARVLSADPNFLDTTQAATFAMDPRNDGEIANIYRRTYDAAKAFSRAAQMAQTTRRAHYQQRAADAIRRAVRLSGTLSAASQAAALASQPLPVLDDPSLASHIFDFERGLWLDGEKT